jgi:hypothetical protein
MTKEKLEKVFEFYRGYLEIRSNVSQYVVSANPLEPYKPKHLMYMICTVLDELIPLGKIEKAMRWLGWVQCAMVVNGFFTLEEVKNHSRPEEGEVE